MCRHAGYNIYCLSLQATEVLNNTKHWIVEAGNSNSLPTIHFTTATPWVIFFFFCSITVNLSV